MKIIDISQEVLSCNVYPGEPIPKAEKLKSITKELSATTFAQVLTTTAAKTGRKK